MKRSQKLEDSVYGLPRIEQLLPPPAHAHTPPVSCERQARNQECRWFLARMVLHILGTPPLETILGMATVQVNHPGRLGGISSSIPPIQATDEGRVPPGMFCELGQAFLVSKRQSSCR